MSTQAAIQAAIAAAAKQTNHSEVQTGGGGEYTPPAKGMARVRLVGYVELGKHRDEKFNKTRDQVKLVFELSGPKHQPHEDEDGNKHPIRMTEEVSLSLNEKAWFYKLFTAMNHDGQATHMAQLVGKEFLADVFHRTTSNKRTFAGLKGPNGYTIRAPYVEDPETGEQRRVSCGPQLSESRVFLWDFATKEMWDALYIEGEYPERKDDEGNVTSPARSKNVFQEQMMSAVNWQGSPMQEILDGEDLGFGDEDEAGGGEEQGAPWDEDEGDPLQGIA